MELTYRSTKKVQVPLSIMGMPTMYTSEPYQQGKKFSIFFFLILIFNLCLITSSVGIISNLLLFLLFFLYLFILNLFIHHLLRIIVFTENSLFIRLNWLSGSLVLSTSTGLAIFPCPWHLIYLIKHAGKATVKKAQRPEEFMGRSIHIPKGGNKMKGQRELQSCRV